MPGNLRQANGGKRMKYSSLHRLEIIRLPPFACRFVFGSFKGPAFPRPLVHKPWVLSEAFQIQG